MSRRFIKLFLFAYRYTVALHSDSIIFLDSAQGIFGLEEVLVRDLWAAYSADLGTSSKESYWDY